MQTIQLRPSRIPGSDDDPAWQDEAWVDIEEGDDEGRRWLASQSGLDDQAVSRLMNRAPATYWRRFGRGIQLNVYSAMPDEDTPTITVSDFGIWLEPGRIITVRRGKVPALVKIAEACSKGAGPSTAWDLIVFVVSEVMSRVEQQLHELTVTIDRLEDEILTVGGDPPLDRVAELQKRIVHARRFQAPLANVVTFLASQADSLVDGARRDEFEGIAGLVAQHRELLGLTIDRTAALQGQIRDRLADSMNTATYRFTWVATVFLPLSFLTGLLGINVAGIPGDHYPLAFWLVCGALALTAAAWGIFVSRMSTSARRRRGPRAPRE